MTAAAWCVSILVVVFIVIILLAMLTIRDEAESNYLDMDHDAWRGDR